jgi:hypothetical protein
MPLVALLVLAAQVAGTPAVPSQPRSNQVCTGVRVTASDQALPPRDLTFSSRTTLDLVLRPRVRRDIPGDHLLRLKVFTPGGFLYQVITLPFVGGALPDGRPPAAGSRSGAAAPTADKPPLRTVDGFPRPLEVQRLAPATAGGGTRGQYEINARLPVAGTSITQSSLYGRWSVQTYLDDQTKPCGPEIRFTIRD